jgi:hypothetical protein
MRFDYSWKALLSPGKSDDFFGISSTIPRSPAFGAHNPQYTPVDAWWLSEMCRLIYRNGCNGADSWSGMVSRSNFLKRFGFREHFFFKGSSPCVIISPEGAEPPPFAVLVFRGTQSLENWFSNLTSIQVPWTQGGMVHLGFKREIFKIWPQVSKVLASLTCPIYYAGHSLGGALAVLAASLRPPAAVYTFGAPRVGDRAFAKAMSSIPVYRIVNHRDIVPTVPPSDIPFNFCHVGELKHLGWLPLTGKDVFSDPKRRLIDPPEILSDHAPVNYSARLLNEINKL